MRLNRNQYGQRQGPRQQGQGRGGQAPNQQIPIQNQPQMGHYFPPPVNFHQPVQVNMRNRAPGRYMGAGQIHWEQQANINPILNQPQMEYYVNPPPPGNLDQNVPVNMRNGAPSGRHMGAGQIHWEQPANVNLQDRGFGMYAAHANNPPMPVWEQRGNQNGGGFPPMNNVPVQMRIPGRARGNDQRFHPYQQDQRGTERK